MRKYRTLSKYYYFLRILKKKLNLFEIFKKHKSIDAIIQKINILKRIHENIVKMQTYFVNYQNKKRKMTFQLKKRKKIYFNTKNLKYKKKVKKEIEN